MIYPFIYTRTLNKDYRLLTSDLLAASPSVTVNRWRAIARAMIDANDDLLQKESFVVVKQDGFTLVGKACLNKTLGHNGQDLYGRLVRGFFGFVSDSPLNQIPTGNDFYSALYQTYVLPVWETYSDSEQVKHLVEIPFGNEVISARSAATTDINGNQGECRVFPASSDADALISEVLGSTTDNSIATNIHAFRQIEQTAPDFIFMNAVMGSETGLTAIETLTAAQLVASKERASRNRKESDSPTSNDGASTGDADGRKDDGGVAGGKGKKGAWILTAIIALIAIVIAIILIFVTDIFEGSGSDARNGNTGGDSVKTAQPVKQPVNPKPTEAGQDVNELFDRNGQPVPRKQNVDTSAQNPMAGEQKNGFDIINEGLKDNIDEPISGPDIEKTTEAMLETLKDNIKETETETNPKPHAQIPKPEGQMENTHGNPKGKTPDNPKGNGSELPREKSGFKVTTPTARP